MNKGSLSSTSFPTLVISCLFDNSHPAGMSSIWLLFWFVFPWWFVILSTFLCTFWTFVSFLLKNVFSYLQPIFKSDCFALFFFAIEFSSLYIMNIAPYTIMTCKYFLLFHRLPFFLLIVSFTCAEVLEFDIVPLTYFFFFCLCFLWVLEALVFFSSFFVCSPPSVSLCFLRVSSQSLCLAALSAVTHHCYIGAMFMWLV